VRIGRGNQVGRPKKAARREPAFKDPGEDLDVRLRPEDRPVPPEADGAEKSARPAARGRLERRRTAKRLARADPTVKERAARGQKGGGWRQSSLARLLYWALVLGLWALIAAVGALIWVGAHLPPIQSLEVPKRPPSIEIVGLNGHVIATRGEMGGAAVPLKELPPYLPQAFIAIEDRRFYSHHGAVAGTKIHQGADPRSLSQSRLFRLRRLRGRGRIATLFRQVGASGHAHRGGASRRSRSLALAA